MTREAAYDMYSHLTGGEEYVDEHSVDEYLERKAREAEEIARRNDELRKALRDGDMDRYNELLGRGGVVEAGRRRRAARSGPGRIAATASAAQRETGGGEDDHL